MGNGVTTSTPDSSMRRIISSGMKDMMRGTWWMANCWRAPMCAWASQTSIGSSR